MLLIVGLDGASLELARNWAEAGRLPHLRRLFAEGAWGSLRSTMPPATFPGWATFMTGMNPGRHGIFDFTRRTTGDYGVQFINGSYRKAPTVWSRLSEAGKRVAVFGVPGTYPPEPLNGCMISGFDTPVTVKADASFVYPPELVAEIEADGGFPFADFQEFRVDRDWHHDALRRLLAGINTKVRVAERQLRKERWDCAMVLFGESDTVAHHFWRFCDPGSPRYDADGAREFGDAICTVYAALDRAIGDLVDAARPDGLLVCSDHGFGGAGASIVHLNRHLERTGLLRWRRGGLAARVARTGKSWALRWLPARLQARCFRLAGGRLASALESAHRFANIDWSGTQAFSEELNYFPSVWINLRGREPAGVVAPEDYDQVCDDVATAMKDLRDPESGAPIVARVWRRGELYQGPWVHLAPDLVLELALPQGYSYTCLPSRGVSCREAVRVASRAEMAGGKLNGMSGSHRDDGMFVLSGPVRPGEGAGANIADLMPTILALCDVPVPGGLDGRVLPCVDLPFRAGPLKSSACGDGDEQAYAPEEARLIERRLQALGYIA